MSCIETSDELTEALRLLGDGPKPVDRLPAAGLEELRRLRWVMGDEVVELAGTGYFHTGKPKGGIVR